MTGQAVKLLNVFWRHGGGNIPLGRLALQDRSIYFEYYETFIDLDIQISPFKLALKSGAQICKDAIFDGLFGVFNDSLPDGWGRLLLDRQVEKYGINRKQLTPLDRLAHVGKTGMGALSYEPVLLSYELSQNDIQLDKIAKESQIVLKGEHDEVFEELLLLNGSSAGARPKIVAGVSENKKKVIHGIQELPKDFSHWVIKFPSTIDPNDIGAVEYAYSLMAKAAGIEMPETHLFESEAGSRYFGIRRFDRQGNKPVHMHSLCGLIHADHRTPSLDYEMVLRVTQALTKNMIEVEKVFRLACFNVLAHNRDDHSKNFSYVLNDQNEWQFAPAYDLTFSYGPSGEQSMLVVGEGKKPGVDHLLQLGKKFSLSNAEETIEQVQSVVFQWARYAQEARVTKGSADKISKQINSRI